MQRANSLKKTLRAGEGGNRGWTGWMASLTQWTWVWANSGRQWRAEKTRVLQFKGLQRVRDSLATEQQPPSSTEWVLESTAYGKGLICDNFKLFICGWAESSLLCAGFLEVWPAGATLHRVCGLLTVGACHGALALELRLSSSLTRGIFPDQGLNRVVPCVGRQIPIYRTTRKDPHLWCLRLLHSTWVCCSLHFYLLPH